MAQQQSGRIHARPNSQKTGGSNTTGLRNIGLETDRDALLYVPESFRPDGSAPLIISFHGAGGTAQQGSEPFRDFADRTGTVILAPEAQDATWDLIQGGFGVDVDLLDEALTDLFYLYRFDPKHIALAGFSDGASYAVSLGATNGDFFTHVIAFSPGFARPEEVRDSPPIFISHGKRDSVLPIDQCSRKLVSKLKEAGLEITYEEFEGGHTIPTEVARRAFTWFLGFDAYIETRSAKARSRESGIEFT